MRARIHSVLGIALVAYLLHHLWAVLPAVDGRDAYMVTGRAPGVGYRLALVGLLLAHAGLGLWGLARRAAPPVAGRGMAWLQGATGLLTVLFIGLHVVHLEVGVTGPHVGAAHRYALLTGSLGRPPVLLAYLAFVTLTVFHAGHGLSRVPFRFGWAETRPRVRAARYVAGVLAAVLWVSWLQVISHLAVGTGLLGGAPPQP